MTTHNDGPWARYRRSKREWKEHTRRVKALPPDYRLVMQEIQKYMWNFASGDQMTPVLYGILDLFEEGAAAGRPVLEVTGDDVAAFCQNILAEVQAATWTGKKAEQLNARIRHQLNRQEPNHE